MNIKQNPPGAVGGTQQTTNFNGNFATNRQDGQDPVEGFLEAMTAAGIEPMNGFVPRDKLTRFRVAGDKVGSENGWAILHMDPPASGAFGHWRTGDRQNWCGKSRDMMTPGERDVLRLRVEADRLARAQEADRRHRVAQAKAVRIWQGAAPVQANGHPYSNRKGVLSHGLRVTKRWVKKVQDDAGIWRELIINNVLLVPMVDWYGVLWNVQAIFAAKDATLGRDKDFLGGGLKCGLFHLLGTIDPSGTLLVAEGCSTGATLHETTGAPILVAFDAGNLLAVATEARRRFPMIDLVVAADNDRHTTGNPGLSKGRAAALASGARLLVPSFADDEPGSDWNDWHQLKKEAANVKSC